MAGFKWNMNGFREIRTSPEIQDEVYALAEDLASEAGDGFAVSGRMRPGPRARFGAIIYAHTNRAYGNQLRSNVLQKVLFARKGAG